MWITDVRLRLLLYKKAFPKCISPIFSVNDIMIASGAVRPNEDRAAAKGQTEGNGA